MCGVCWLCGMLAGELDCERRVEDWFEAPAVLSRSKVMIALEEQELQGVSVC